MGNQGVHPLVTLGGELAVAGIAHQQALALQVTGDAVNDGVRQLCEFIAGRRLDPNNGSD